MASDPSASSLPAGPSPDSRAPGAIPPAAEPPSPDEDLIAVLTTVATEDQALQLADALVAQRLAACVHLEPVRSVYRWQGEVVHDEEWRLLIKAPARAWTSLREAVLAAHPYELPALVALPVLQVHAPYAQWVREQVRSPGV